MNLNSAKMMNIQLYCPKRKSEINQLLLDKLQKYDWVQLVGRPSDESYLIIEEGQLGLADSNYPKVHPVVVDFLSGASNHRRLHGGGAGQAVAKAVGLNKKKDLVILDATAGLGRDAFVMASLGASVTLFERNPVVFELLKDGLNRLDLSGDPDIQDILSRLTLKPISLIGSEDQMDGYQPDIVYLDPMFPERGKSAKVKKDMTMFHSIVGDDSDADKLLEPALALAKLRVVVKRSKNAPILNGVKPTTALVGKSSRFDIYSKKAIV
jgi:16S rRNA (guanine1516-N2)-methyltransferase